MITLAVRSCLRPRIGRSRAFKRPMVGLDPVIGVPIGAMPGCRQELGEDDRVGRRLIGDHLDGSDLGRADSLLEEAASGSTAALRGDEHVDDLANWSIARYVAPLAGDLHIGLIHLSAVADGMSAGMPSVLPLERGHSERNSGLSPRHVIRMRPLVQVLAPHRHE
jgi:hypothetical protein